MTPKWKFNSTANIIVLGQAIIFNSIYLYSQINKWNIIEELTGFIMPFYTIIIMELIIISTIISSSYFIIQIIEVRKIFICVPVFINMAGIIVQQIKNPSI